MRLPPWLRSVADKLASAPPNTRIIHGVWVRVSDNRANADPEHLFKKMTAALGLIAEYQPHRLRRLPNDMDVIWVREHNMCRAAFYGWPDLRACVLDDYFIGTFPEEQIASSIVHEGVHARLRSAGVPWTDCQAARAREERLCREAELSFGLAIPNGEAVAERARVSLLLDDDNVAPRLA
ncbi:hypothetical protein BH20GEM3_BH20GEM3_04240 [soil metagenome]